MSDLIASWGDEPYVPCPRCEGRRQVFAYTSLGNDFQPIRGEYFTCPLCHGTGEAARAMAVRFVNDSRDEDQ